MQQPGDRTIRIQGWCLFVMVSLLALSLFASRGTGDVNLWLEWIDHLQTHGLVAGYAANEADYPPLSSAILLAVATVAQWVGIDPFYGLKLSLFGFLLLTSLLFLAWTRSLLLASLLQAVLILNSMGLSYIDVYFAPPLLLALWALQTRKLLLFAIFFTITCLIKWQPIVIAPFLLVYLLRIGEPSQKPAERRAVLRSVMIPAVVVVAVAFALFGLEIWHSFRRATSHAYLSGTALNAGWILTHLLHRFDPQEYGPLMDGHATFLLVSSRRIVYPLRILFLLLYGIALMAFVRRPKTYENVLRFAIAGYLAYFTFNTGVHENHLFVVVILAAVLLAMSPQYGLTFATWAVAANVNLFIFYGVTGKPIPSPSPLGFDAAFLLSFLSIVTFAGYYGGVVGAPVPPSPVGEGRDGP